MMISAHEESETVSDVFSAAVFCVRRCVLLPAEVLVPRTAAAAGAGLLRPGPDPQTSQTHR